MRDRGMLDNRYVLVNGSFANLNIDGLLTIDGAADDNIFRLGEVALDLDFTGTDYDTVAECEAMGLKFGDSVTYPFPDQLVPAYATDEPWSHDAGTGWKVTLASGVSSGGFILVPLMRPGNWEAEVVIDFTPTNVDQVGLVNVGYISNSNHMGANAVLLDISVIASEVTTVLQTNDGDDTPTSRYTGAAQGTGNITLALRSINGVLEVYDDQDNLWHPYEGHQSTGISYTAGWVYFGLTNLSTHADPWVGVHIRNFKLTYLL